MKKGGTAERGWRMKRGESEYEFETKIYFFYYEKRINGFYFNTFNIHSIFFLPEQNEKWV